MSKLTVKRALPKGNGHNAIILEGEGPVSNAAAGSMGNLASPMGCDLVRNHSSTD